MRESKSNSPAKMQKDCGTKLVVKVILFLENIDTFFAAQWKKEKMHPLTFKIYPKKNQWLL